MKSTLFPHCHLEPAALSLLLVKSIRAAGRAALCLGSPPELPSWRTSLPTLLLVEFWVPVQFRLPLAECPWGVGHCHTDTVVSSAFLCLSDSRCPTVCCLSVLSYFLGMCPSLLHTG